MHCKKEDTVFDKIVLSEYNQFESTNNGGLLYLLANGSYKNCYGYDLKMAYASILGNKNSSFKIAYKCGFEKMIIKLPKDLQYGIYRILITASDKNFLKIFKLNEKHFYTHYDLQFIRKFKIKYPDADVEMNLIIDDKPNVLVYYSKDVKLSNKIFGSWFIKIKKLKKEFPKNNLVKHLSSTLWGSLSHAKTYFMNSDEFFDKFDDEKFILIDCKFVKMTQYYKVVDTSKGFYKTSFRLKPFITSYCRCKIAQTIVDNDLISNVIRINTDGIILDKKFDFSKYDKEFVAEEKSTGNIKFDHINKYEKFD
jgi:hypothetical protein